MQFAQLGAWCSLLVGDGALGMIFLLARLSHTAMPSGEPGSCWSTSERSSCSVPVPGQRTELQAEQSERSAKPGSAEPGLERPAKPVLERSAEPGSTPAPLRPA